MSKKLIRVQSPDGTKRVEITNETLAQFYERVFAEFKIDKGQASGWSLFTDREHRERLPNCRNTRAGEVVAHGDMIYLLQAAEKNVSREESEVQVAEDEIDTNLDKQEGMIFRKKDELL
jgi:hypothetical protein